MTPGEIEAIFDDESTDVAKSKLLHEAQEGNPVAQFYMGHLCDSPPRDAKAALEWYCRASEGGHAEATHWLGSFLYHGMGGPRDVEAALILFRKCAVAGNSASQWALGRHLVQSQATQDEGLLWLRRAAAQGHEGAKNELQDARYA